MGLKNHSILSTVQFDELRKFFDVSEENLPAKWRLIQHMRSDLNLDPNLPIKDLIYLYSRFEEIKDIFKLKSVTFAQLERILIEIETVKDMLGIVASTPLHLVLLQILNEDISSLGVGNNSILENIVKYL